MTVNKSRIYWIDIAKGIGIFLVVFGHYTQTLYSEDGNRWSFIFYWIYSFHMPLFFFLSGIVAKNETFTILIHKLKKGILFPTLIFSVIYTLYKLCLGNEIIYWSDIIFCKSNSFIHLYWFMWTMLWVKLVYQLLYDLLKKEHLVLVVSIVLVVISSFIDNHNFLLRLPLCTGNVCYTLPFYACGVVLKNLRTNHLRSIIPVLCLMLSLLTNIIWLDGVSYALLSFHHWTVDYLKAFLGIFTVIGLAQNIETEMSTITNRLEKIGQESLYIYLIHGFFFWGLYKKLLQYIPDNFYFILLFTLLFTILTITIIHIAMCLFQKFKEFICATQF